VGIGRRIVDWMLLRTPETAAPDEIADPDLRAAVADVEAYRQEKLVEARRRARVLVPLSIVVCVGLAIFSIVDDAKRGKEPDLGMILLPIMSPAIGLVLATMGPERAYKASYRDRIVPRLLARHGVFTYSHAARADIGRLRKLNLLPKHDRADAEDEIAGRHCGLDVRVYCLKLSENRDKKTVTVFSGLIIGVRLKRPLSGTTAIARDQGGLGNLLARLGSGLERVRLEDPRFESVFEVYGTDQVEARALLTPAAMERLRDLPQFARGHGGGVPVMLAEGDTITFALPYAGAINLIAAGKLTEPAANLAHFAAIDTDIRLILSAVEAAQALNPRYTHSMEDR
jgi:hypothetical protein